MSEERPFPEDIEAVLRRKAKVQIRKRMRSLRSALPMSACAERSSKIVASLLAHEALRSARTVASFWPMEDRHEVDLRPLDHVLRERGVRLVYPAIDPETRIMTFRLVRELGELEERGFGFAEPPPSAEEVDLATVDAILVPALAVDVRGHRLGYGAGYYDRALAAAPKSTATIVVAFEFQLVAEVPDMPSDVAVGFIVTDTRSLRADNSSSGLAR